MSWRIRLLVIAFALSLSLTITGCGLQGLLGKKNKTSSINKGKPQSVLAVSLNEEDPNKLIIAKGINDLAQKNNVQVKYIDAAAEGKESDLKGVKVLVYQEGNPSVLQKAQTNKIPVLALTQLPSGVKPDGIIAPDEEKAGELMAQSLVNKVSEGQVLILQGDPNNSGFQERLAGNKAVLAKYPKITVQTVSSTPGTESVAKQSLADYLRKTPGKVQGVMAYTDKLAGMANEVLKQGQLDKKIVLIGGQASIASLERMANGSQAGDIDTSPYLQGASAYQWAQKIINKEPYDVNDSITGEQGEVPAKIIQVKAVTPENLSLIQKGYFKTMQSAQQDQKQKEQKKPENQVSQGKDKSKSQGESSQSEQQSGGSQGSGSATQQNKANKIPSGVQKVTERIRTEITREYLDGQGNVIGTEKTANEQIRTLPPEMIKQEDQAKETATENTSSKDSSKDQGEQSSKDKGSKQ